VNENKKQVGNQEYRTHTFKPGTRGILDQNERQEI
jgi:hypothetical protein